MFPHTAKIFLGVSGILVILLGYGGYEYFLLQNEKNALAAQLAQAQTKLDSIAIDFQNKIVDFEGRLLLAQKENEELEDELREEKDKNDEFEDQIEDITDTVGTLEKLSKTDPELLQKYSKVYFLNEHYVPPKVVTISSEFTYTKDRSLQIHASVLPALKDLLNDAQDDGETIQVISAYRSFGTQTTLKSGYNVTYGAGTANQFSADQGYSEHQLGTTVDFTTPAVGATFTGFENTSAYKWLVNNAYRYGFVLSYPPGNAYYQYEPWHWRFVGKDLARTLKRKDMNFYDMDQREIDTYLADIFE